MQGRPPQPQFVQEDEESQIELVQQPSSTSYMRQYFSSAAKRGVKVLAGGLAGGAAFGLMLEGAGVVADASLPPRETYAPTEPAQPGLLFGIGFIPGFLFGATVTFFKTRDTRPEPTPINLDHAEENQAEESNEESRLLRRIN